MKFSNNWVRQWCPTELCAQEVADTITMAGLEVDACLPSAPVFNNVVVGFVKNCRQHPNADKLRIAQVDVGEDELLDIVCGAPNCREGIWVAVAKVGAVLPDNFKIKASKLRGEMSAGMLCSIKELGLAEENEGIWELPSDAPIGSDIRAYLDLDDTIIEVDLTPNRADCFSIRGIARELAALTGTVVNSITNPKIAASHAEIVPIHVSAPQACPRYLSRVVTGINNNAATPIWMQEKLRRGGIRSLHPVVDILNYVMLELGQPMHAFDAACIQDALHVRYAQDGETLTLLDGQEIALQSDTLVIADSEKPLALAGIFGGQSSGVTENTTDVVLESAFFAPLALAGRARQYGLHTDSSMRYERGVDYLLQQSAMERATRLIIEVCGGEAGPVQHVVAEEHLPKQPAITLRKQRLDNLLGIELASDKVASILTRLGLQVEPCRDGWVVVPPSYRFDMHDEVDLIEEVARVYGYNQLPSIAPHAELVMPEEKAGDVTPAALKAQLTGSGLQEVITYSFTDPKLQTALFPELNALTLQEPISQDMSVMRVSLWAGLLQTASYNLNRQQTQLRLFEYGTCFIPDVEKPSGVRETLRLGGLVAGLAVDGHWDKQSKLVDFFDLKGHVEQIFDFLGIRDYVRYQRDDRDGVLHPGQAAVIVYQDQVIGYLGALHPRLHKAAGVKQAIYLFELDLAPLLQKQTIQARALSRFPSIKRDLAIVVDKETPAQDVFDIIKEAGGTALVDINLFDIYQGETIAVGKKSLALSLTLQRLDKTLEDSEVNTLTDTIVHALQTHIHASLRE